MFPFIVHVWSPSLALRVKGQLAGSPAEWLAGLLVADGFYGLVYI